MSDKFAMGGTGGAEISQCLYCRHRRPGVFPIECPAFPDGIPDAILANDFDHRDPYPGDHGYRLEPADGEEDDVKELYGWLDAKKNRNQEAPK